MKPPRHELKSARTFVVIVMFVISAGFVGLAIYVATRPPVTSVGRLPPILMQVTAEVAPDRETVLELPDLGVTVYVPAGALGMEGYLGLTPREPDLFHEAGHPVWYRPTIVNLEILDREGNPVPFVGFGLQVLVCFELSEQEWQALEENAKAFEVHQYDDRVSPPQWVPAPLTLRPHERQLCGGVLRPGLVALAVRSRALVPGRIPTPEEGAYEPYGS